MAFISGNTTPATRFTTGGCDVASRQGCCEINSFGRIRGRTALFVGGRARLVQQAERKGGFKMCSATGTATATVEEFLKAAGEAGLGTMRFITVTDGAVLETIGRLDYGTKKFSVPGKGEYVTIASEDKMFECHLNMTKVKTIEMSEQKAKIGDHQLYVVRFKADEGALMLSCLLQYDPSVGPGNYLYGAIDGFRALKERFGDVITVEHV